MQKNFSCKGIKELIIGDPMYLDGLDTASPKDKEALLSLIFREKVPSSFKGKYSVSKEHMVLEDGFKYDEISVVIALARDIKIGKEELVDVFLDNRLVKTNDCITVYHEERLLGCDTATFVIQTGHCFDEFKTGADGYYGDCLKESAAVKGERKKLYGYVIRISLDADLFNEEDVAASLDCVFGLK